MVNKKRKNHTKNSNTAGRQEDSLQCGGAQSLEILNSVQGVSVEPPEDTAMSQTQNKSKEEVLAARQAKKKNKGKKKTSDEGDNVAKETQSVRPTTAKETQCVKPTTANETVEEEQRNTKPTAVVLKVKETKNENKSVQSAYPSDKITDKNTQSREEVLAEREAKRLAKQLGKSKINSGAVETKECATLLQSAVELATEKVASVSLETDTSSSKSKAELKAERRAKQEAQRAKKLDNPIKSSKPIEKKIEDVKPGKTFEKIEIKKTTPTQNAHRAKLVAHLYVDIAAVDALGITSDVHPSILRLGTQYQCRVVSGSNVRCLALLNALAKVVDDFTTPANQEFSRGLEAEITKSMSYLHQCRPVAVSMVNAVKHLRYQVTHMQGPEATCKKQLETWIETYVRDQLEKASEAICLSVHGKITSGDVILTYGCSSLIQRILTSAHKKKLRFRVIVVDSRPWLEGREMLRRLVREGIVCTYVFVTGLSFVMPEVTKVLLGTHALLANGYVMSRAGSSQIALLAKAFNVPVLVCCETHKFSERVQTDSFVYNELGDPDDLLSKELSKWRKIACLTPLNLTYDVTPPDLVTAVVTEVAVLPCTSVPVILRIKPAEVSC